MQQNDPKPKKKIITYVVTAITFAAAYFGTQYLFKPPSIDKALIKTASDMNKLCPIMADKETRLDNTVALPGTIFEYNYTLINTDVATIDTALLRQAIETRLINNVKTSPEMKAFRTNKVTLMYSYSDKNGNHISTLTITPDMYAGQ